MRFAERFGDKARSPVDYLEQNWAIERYSGGAMIAHTPPGVLTEFGPALREPAAAFTGPEPKPRQDVRVHRRSRPLRRARRDRGDFNAKR